MWTVCLIWVVWIWSTAPIVTVCQNTWKNSTVGPYWIIWTKIGHDTKGQCLILVTLRSISFVWNILQQLQVIMNTLYHLKICNFYFCIWHHVGDTHLSHARWWTSIPFAEHLRSVMLTLCMFFIALVTYCKLTFYTCQSHTCDTVQIDHPHSNPHVLKCKIQTQM